MLKIWKEDPEEHRLGLLFEEVCTVLGEDGIVYIIRYRTIYSAVK
jgi:hypothetical protein